MPALLKLKTEVLTYINHFGIYDYAAYIWLILLFFFTVLLSIVLARRAPVISLLLVVISLLLLFIAPFTLKHYLVKYIRVSSTQTLLIKKLNFSDTLIVTGSLTNLSKNSFSTCSVSIGVIKSSKSPPSSITEPPSSITDIPT